MSAPTTLPRLPNDSSPDHGEQLVQPPVRSVHDPFCIVVWNFVIDGAGIDSFHEICDAAAAQAADHPKTLFQRTTCTGAREFQVRVGLEDSFGVLSHVVFFSEALERIVKLGDFRGLEIHGPAGELRGLREPLRPFAPALFERTADSII